MEVGKCGGKSRRETVAAKANGMENYFQETASRTERRASPYQGLRGTILERVGCRQNHIHVWGST